MNKYERWYNALIERSKIRAWTKSNSPCYVESHHIIPKSLGGKNSKENNPMNNSESRAKVSASKIGRTRIYREDGSFYMSKVD